MIDLSKLTADLITCGVPDHDHEGLERWIRDGILPGSFLTAVLENDLLIAVGQADDVNRAHLWEICGFLYNHAPSGCYGSKAKVRAWAVKHARTRAEQQKKEQP